MAYRYARRKKTGLVFWSRLVAGGVVLFPLSVNHTDFRAVFARGISVAAYRASPAFAAFEDVKEDYKDEIEIPARTQSLNAGRKFNPARLIDSSSQRVVALRGMTLRVDPKPFYVAGQSPRLSAPSAIGSRPPLAQSHFASQRTIRTASGGSILVASAGPAAGEPGNSTPIYNDMSAESPSNDDAALPATGLSALASPAGSERPLWLNGQIEMTGGLAYVGPDTQLVVKHVVDGASLESGRIWITEGKFEIRVKSAIGFLVAELRNHGRVLGRGELNLYHLHDIQGKSDRISDLRIALRPTTETASFRPVSDAAPAASPSVVRDARVAIQAYTDPQPVNEDGFVTEPTLDRDSSFVVRAAGRKHWSTLVVGQAGRPQDIRLFSNSLVEALINLNLENGTDRAEAFHMSVVWGQITRDGAPLTGAQVEMAGEFKPIYFNEAYIPDRKMSATGKNGLFAFLRVKAGVQAVRVKYARHLYPAQVFPTENKHVSYVELDLRNKIVSQFKVLDVLDMNKPVTARIRQVGTDAMLDMPGDQYVEYSVAANTFMIEAEASPEYEVSRTTLNGSPHLVHVPMVKRDWLRSLAIERGIGAAAGRGTVVGFVDDQNFEVEMTGYGTSEAAQVVYFDAQGLPVPSGSGVAGGGFVIFNAPAGLQTVFIHPLQSRSTFSQIVVAEPEYVHVLAWSPARP